MAKLRKKRRRRIHVYPRNLLTISGVLQVSLMTIHIEAITRMTTVIVGFYLLAFILATTINILNGYSFKAGGSVSAIAGTAGVTAIQLVFGVLYIAAMLEETAWLSAEQVIPQMGYSIALFAAGMFMAVIALLIEIKVYFTADEIYKFMM